MSRWVSSLAVLSLVCVADRLAAAELCAHGLDRELQCVRCAAFPCWCADDYCPKPFPCIPCPPRTALPDDYCRKPLPCLPCFRVSWRADDYCPKPFPRSCWPANEKFYRCPPGADSADSPRTH